MTDADAHFAKVTALLEEVSRKIEEAKKIIRELRWENP